MANKEKPSKKNVITLCATVVVALLLLAFYYFSMNFEFFRFVMWGYMIALAALVIAYIIYNKGMYLKGVTEEMLPDEMSIEEKRALIDGAKRRLERSKWMIMLIIGFIFTFAVEAVLLFVLPWVEGMIG
jgi:multisubunit Na+/H+ antiporter MnhB subunit